LSEPFKPAWWCRGPHAQTLWPYVFRRSPRITLRRERLELPDGDFLDLDWTPETRGPIVLVLHGLEGSSNSKYARGLLKALHGRGWRGVLMHFRGCSGEPNRLARRYHSGETGDLAHVLSILRQREPATPLAAVGYSLGGNVLLKWLGETATETSHISGRMSVANRDTESSRGPRLDPVGETGAIHPLRAAVAVSVPFLLANSAARLETGFSRIYQWSLVRRLKKATWEKHRFRPLPIDMESLSRLQSFRQFDEHVTAPLHGFEGADHYYRVSSSRQYLSGIRLPTLILHSLDDPFMTPDTPPEPGELSPSIKLELYAHGGHVGFVGGAWPWHARYWLEERIPSFLQPLLTSTGQPVPVAPTAVA
jgi:predicted alpha/beta-fold hydrolase